MHPLRPFVALAGLLATAAACGPAGSAPELDPIPDQIVAVGTQLVIELRATNMTGSDISYSFSSNAPNIQDRASISRTPAGNGIFRWTPQAADVGLWYFDFIASDGGHDTSVTVAIEVRSAVGEGTAPVFREPLGTGTTLDLSVRDCLTVNIVVEDQDSASVIIAQEEPVIEGATLMSTGGLTATWRWCPTAAQIGAADRYTLTLSADDLSNPKTIKNYLVVLRKPGKPDCPGEPPVIEHTPMNVSSLVGLTIDARVTDDQGLKHAPLLYYSTSAQADPPDLGAMTQVSMLLLSGTMVDGVWAADVPNPVAGMPMGSMAQLHYVIVAIDDDDPNGDCDHLTQAPVSGTYSMTITNPGGAGGAGLCQACTADVQCGGAPDLCVRVGAMADSFCLRSCSSQSDCPTDYTCSTSAVTSVDGGSGRQCVPSSNDCSDPGGSVCVNDDFEPNDTRAQAAANPALLPGTYSNLVSCPADNDWYRIVITQDSQVTLTLAGGSTTDLDLGLYDVNGGAIRLSMSLDSNEMISECLEPGTYYVRVWPWGSGQNPYTLTYSRTNSSCAACQDDGYEPDDGPDEARLVDLDQGAHVSETNAICPYNDDWFAVLLYDTETVYVDLTFTQQNSLEDLDLHFYDDYGVNLTPCSEAEPWLCSAAQGQSGSSNEHYQRTINDSSCSFAQGGCFFYVVVRGWNGSSNLYDIRIGLTPKP